MRNDLKKRERNKRANKITFALMSKYVVVAGFYYNEEELK